LHYQIVVAFSKKESLASVTRLFGTGVHAELTRSEAACAYVHKEETRAGEPFEHGAKPINRSSKIDWESVWPPPSPMIFSPSPRLSEFKVIGPYELLEPTLLLLLRWNDKSLCSGEHLGLEKVAYCNLVAENNESAPLNNAISVFSEENPVAQTSTQGSV
jgi:hypothetical protein